MIEYVELHLEPGIVLKMRWISLRSVCLVDSELCILNQMN